MSYRFVHSFRTGAGWNCSSILVLLESCSHILIRSSCKSVCYFFSLSLNFTMAPSLIETNQPFHSDLIFAKGMVASGVAHRFDLFILTCLRTVFRRATIGRIPLDEWSARRRDLYLTTHNTHNRQTDKYPCPRWDSNPQSQQASGRRPTP